MVIIGHNGQLFDKCAIVRRISFRLVKHSLFMYLGGPLD